MLSTVLFSLATAAIAAAAPAELTTRQATASQHIFNRCSFDVNFWLDGQGPQVLRAGADWGEFFMPDHQRTITLMTSPRINSPDAKLLTSYTYRPDAATVWFEMYSLDSTSPFQGFKVVQTSADTSCRAQVWGNGVPPADRNLVDCRSDRDVNLYLCAQ
jgi:hypothetical protein